MNYSIDPNKRVIDITYGDLIVGLRKDILAEAMKKPELLILPGIHPETGLPEAPEEEVGDNRAREILRSKANPVSKTTLRRYRAQPAIDITGRNNGGYSLPYNIIAKKCMYKVKDLLALRKDLHYFMKQI